MILSSALFCYGTLCFPDIMRAVSGTVPTGTQATLGNYVCYQLYGVNYPAIVPAPGASVSGILYRNLQPQQLRCIDRYEGNQYNRTIVEVTDSEGQVHKVWSYVLAQVYYHRIKRQTWELDKFAKCYLAKYIRRHGWR